MGKQVNNIPGEIQAQAIEGAMKAVMAVFPA